MVAADAEGTALGCVGLALLALLALGRADDLVGAVHRMADRLGPDAPRTPAVVPDPELVGGHRRVVARLPELVRALGSVADLLGRGREGQGPGLKGGSGPPGG